MTSAGGPPLREILGSATNHGSPSGGNESPHPSFQYAAIANAAAASGFPTDNSATSFLSPSSGAGGGAVPVSAVHSTHSDLIYDSINMSQVQNYSPSLSSSLGSSLTPLTPIPISDVNKSSASTAAAMLQGPTISVLGEHNAQFQSVGSGSISTVLPPSDYYNTSYQQYSSYGYGYPSGMGSGSLLSK